VLTAALHDERGYLLPMLIIVLVIGFFIIMPLLSFVDTSIRTWDKSAEEELAYYAADAGIGAVLSDLRQGEDALSPSYSVPSVTLNYYTPTVTVEEPPRADPLPFGPVFVDPGATTSLYPLAGKTEFLYEADNVQAGSPMQVNWVYTPADSDYEITVYEGSGTGGTQVVGTSGSGSPARVTIPGTSISGGTYTIRFYNNSDVTIYSAEFSTIGDTTKTWLRVTAFKDYVITSTAGDITIKVFARQGPGPNPAESAVGIMTWQTHY
jgi:hypothetical protein